MKNRLISDFRADDRGVAAIELAILLPVILLALFGCAEVLMQTYTRSNIHMLLRQAARDSIVVSADMEKLESSLRSSIEKLPGVYGGNDLVIKICQEKGCSTAPVTVDEYVDVDGSNTCNAPGGISEKWTDKNRNGIKEKAGILVTGNTLGGPGDPVIFQVRAKARYFFGAFSFLGKNGQVEPFQYFSISAVGANEDFNLPEIYC
jgi:Flp pilus assembly pilin Flp